MPTRTGFTLVELMLVTVIIGILATVAVAEYSSVRDKSMLAVVHTELRQTMTDIERYQAVTGTLPATLDDLVNGGYHVKSKNVNYCTFEVQTGGPEPYVEMEAAHKSSTTHLEARYPLWGVKTQQISGTNDCG
ncbi:MAG TPA: prepilin-type N-terminal cleavage/methylation domain-containing protein [Longimicrobiales bacterium]|nr:prepilin-type N-terminal cleavage/methylation domain-containing protein [Longimicrobiales bacterium]